MCSPTCGPGPNRLPDVPELPEIQAHAERLTDEFGLTQEQIAAAVGKDRSTVANLLRLLRLPQEIRAELSSDRLTVGHARALLSLPEAADQKHVAREVISRSQVDYRAKFGDLERMLDQSLGTSEDDRG